jgi:hypothetical protein
VSMVKHNRDIVSICTSIFSVEKQVSSSDVHAGDLGSTAAIPESQQECASAGHPLHWTSHR